MRLIFAGTPETAVPSLAALVEAGQDVALVITREDAPLGRKRILTPSPVAQWAEDTGLSVLKTNRIGSAELELIRRADADLGVVVAYGAILNPHTLAATRQGWVNLHFSALPRWRGAAPVQRSLMAGDTQAATCVFELVSDLDAGPIIDTELSPIDADDTAESLLERLSRTGAHQLVRVVDDIERQKARSQSQQGEPTYAAKLSVDDGEFRVYESGQQTYNRFRGVTREPGFFFHDGGLRVKVLEARLAATRAPAGSVMVENGRVYLGTQTLALELRRVQPAGKVAMAAGDWMRGRVARSEAQ